MEQCQWHDELTRAVTTLTVRIPEDLAGSMARLETTANNTSREVREIREALHDDFVTRTEFEPVKRLVYGTVGLILTAVVLALIGLVMATRGV